MELQVDELDWKLVVNYDRQKDVFILYINDVSFSALPPRFELNPIHP